jgi:uncharacterized protein (TIGR02598 family)
MKVCRRRRAFSLVEVVIALGICTFAMLTIVALLPLGVSTNRISVEETQASGLLTGLEADLRNTHPLATPSGQSLLFNLPLPYVWSAGQIACNSALELNKLYTIGLNRNQSPVAVTATPRPDYQLSVIYIRLPGTGSLQPVEGRVIVSWPCLANAAVADVTNPTKVSGFVEGYVAFPMP